MPKVRKPENEVVRSTIEFPPELWRAAKIRAMDERTDLRDIVLRSLRAYLAKAPSLKKGGR
jgi:hypothetical protein